MNVVSFYTKMIARSLIIRRTLATKSKTDIGQIFNNKDVRHLLQEITRYDESKLFARKPVPRLKTPQMMFMTDDQLRRAKEDAYSRVEARMQMPPVMEADTSEPKVISRDEEITGYTQFKIMFIDIGPGYSNRNRLMSVREPDGTLRYPTHAERSRLNHIFFPSDHRSIDSPKLFEEENLLKLLQRKDYVYVLNRATIQFEPDDPRYVDITTRIYNYIDDKGDFDHLRSTRHFGPMCLFLAYNRRPENLILEMLSKDLVGDAVKLVKLYNICHNVETVDDGDPLEFLSRYAENHAEQKKYNFDLALQRLQSKSKDVESSSTNEDEKK